MNIIDKNIILSEYDVLTPTICQYRAYFSLQSFLDGTNNNDIDSFIYRMTIREDIDKKLYGHISKHPKFSKLFKASDVRYDLFKTKIAISSKHTVKNAGFQIKYGNGLFIKINIQHLNVSSAGLNITEVRFVSRGRFDKDEGKREHEFFLSSIKRFVIEELGYKVNSWKLLLINTEYVRKSKFNINDVFDAEEINLLEQPVPKGEIKINLNDWSSIKKFKSLKQFTNNRISNFQPHNYIDKRCKYSYSCPFRNRCETKSKNRKTVVDMPSFCDYMNKFDSKKILHIDFETLLSIIPQYVKYKPYGIEARQFCAIETDENGNVTKNAIHYIDVKDSNPAKRFAKELIKITKPYKIVTCYSPYEIRVIKELAQRCPDLKKDLEKILPKIIDLARPFQKKWVVLKDVIENKYSIKFLLPVLSDDESDGSYEDLAIQKGLTASIKIYEAIHTNSKKEKNEIVKNLKEYCEQDVKTQILVYKKLIDLL